MQGKKLFHDGWDSCKDIQVQGLRPKAEDLTISVGGKQMGPGDTFECLKSGDTIVLGNAIFGRAAEEQDASELEKVALDLHAGGSNLQMVIDYLEDEAEHPLFDMWDGKVSLYALILSLTLH